MSGTRIEFSVSTWQQPIPALPVPERADVLERIADLIADKGRERLRVAVDGITAAGKTSLGHELARELSGRGRPVARASLDDFKRPWSERHRYDRESGEGYYRNAFDLDAVRRLLLDPTDPTGNGIVALCSIDPLTQVDRSRVTTAIPPDGVLLVDGVFAFRPEMNDAWDLRIWIDVEPELSIQRGVARDAGIAGAAAEVGRVHRDRYLVAERLYIEEVDPRAFVDVIIDNSDFDRPQLIRPA